MGCNIKETAKGTLLRESTSFEHLVAKIYRWVCPAFAKWVYKYIFVMLVPTPLHLQGGPLSHSAKATQVGPLRNLRVGVSVCMHDV